MITKPVLGIVGVGLIGGSIGLAARRSGQFGKILGAGRDSANLERARIHGCVDEGTTELSALGRQADLIVFCTPVDQIAGQILYIADQCKPGTLITDAGSAKAQIVSQVDNNLPARADFIGSHPLAGSEKRGAEHARADLFDNRLTIVTPTPRTSPNAERRATEFWQQLGSRVTSLAPAKHDQALALTSHLPHLLASALAAILPEEWQELTANGFRDTTRIAAGDPALWTPIFCQNRLEIAAASIRLGERLVEFNKALLTADEATLTRLLAEGKKVRDDLGS
jgi:cyclohexadieny/prephenate dehydrogenase